MWWHFKLKAWKKRQGLLLLLPLTTHWLISSKRPVAVSPCRTWPASRAEGHHVTAACWWHSGGAERWQRDICPGRRPAVATPHLWRWTQRRRQVITSTISWWALGSPDLMMNIENVTTNQRQLQPGLFSVDDRWQLISSQPGPGFILSFLPPKLKLDASGK